MRTVGKVLVILAALAIPAFLAFGPNRTEAAAPGLSESDIRAILAAGEASANATNSADGLRSNTDASKGPIVTRKTKMHIAVVDRDGKLRAVRSMDDAWVGSYDIAIGKARTAAFFSSDENALTSRIIGELSQAHGSGGTGGAGPLWGIWASNQIGISGSQEFRNGLITFPGGVPLYKDGKLVGGVGVSGDGVDPDEAVAFAAAAGYGPGSNVVKLGY